MPFLGSFYFHHWYPSGLEVAGEPSAIAAGPLHAGAPHGPEAFRPGDEALVAHRGRRHTQRSQATAQLVQSYSHVQIEVRVHAQDHLGQGG